QCRRPVPGLQATLELVPRQPLGRNPVLPLPLPIATSPAGGRDHESLLAYRAEAVEARMEKSLGIRGVDAEAFANLWRTAGLGDPGRNIHAFAFQRQGRPAPVLQLRWNWPAVQAAGQQEVRWRYGRRQAEVHVTAKLSSTD